LASIKNIICIQNNIVQTDYQDYILNYGRTWQHTTGGWYRWWWRVVCRFTNVL